MKLFTTQNSSDGDVTPQNLRKAWLLKILFRSMVACLGLLLAAFCALALALTAAWPNLPSVDSLTDYRPKIPLRIYSADGALLGEFGEERRNFKRIKDIPDVMKKALLSIEDDRFYDHGGVDWVGVMRAGLSNLANGLNQGASTITMQLARTFFLTNERTFGRKIYEILLAYKIEEKLTKDQILEVYMNQIYLGQRAYGFATAAQVYFGKPLEKISIAEAAMLAGLPKAPSAYNPVVNPKRAHARQQYILQRMHSLGYITTAQFEQAKKEEINVLAEGGEFEGHADYVAEMARQLVHDQYKENTYSRGLNVYTTILKTHQEAAYAAVRKGVLDYERRHGYRGAEGMVELPKVKTNKSVEEKDTDELEDAIDEALLKYRDSDELLSAVVLEADAKHVRVQRSGGEIIDITGEGLRFAQAWLSDKAQSGRKLTRGAVVRIVKETKEVKSPSAKEGKEIKTTWSITQLPEVEAAFVSTNPDDGAIRALVGGFDFNRSKFNHVTQAWRQPGSSFKPFIYSASLEKGLYPATMINDAPIVVSAAQTGSQEWSPKNYDGKFEGPMRMRQGLQKSKNMVSIRILQSITPQYAQDYVTRFGFDAEKHPPYLTMALGAGTTNMLQMAAAYAVFANGGFKINPYLISKITDQNGKILAQAQPIKAGNEDFRAIDTRNAFITETMLKDVVRYGTATSAMKLKRSDLAGKTGTTNDSHDAWFAGYQPKLVGVAWMGFDQPKDMGSKETGGGLALPIWINYMATALKGVPEVERKVPEGVLFTGGDYYYTETPPGTGVASLGLSDPMPNSEEPKDMPLIPGWNVTPLPNPSSAP